MRFAISIVAALMILGLAAFGVVSAQKMSTAPSQATVSDFGGRPGAASRARCRAASPGQSRQPSGSSRPGNASGGKRSGSQCSGSQCFGSQCSGGQRSGCCRSDAGSAGDPDDAGRSERRLGTAEARAFGDRHPGVR